MVVPFPASSAEPVLVHGDLHHDNVLSSARAGWLAIDPKGVAAEPAYETAAMLRNPRSKLQQHPELEQILNVFINGDWHKRFSLLSGVPRMKEEDGNMPSVWQKL